MSHLKTEDGGDPGALFVTALDPDPGLRPARARTFALGLMGASGVDTADAVAQEPPTQAWRAGTVEPERFADVELRPAEAELGQPAERRPSVAEVPVAAGSGSSRFVFGAAMLWIGVVLGFVAGYGWRPEPMDSPVPVVESTEVSLPGQPDTAPAPAPADAAPDVTPTAAPSIAPPTDPPARDSAPIVRSGELQIRSVPTGAQVSINGKPGGVTPLILRDLPFGSYTIRLMREGYVAEERRLQLTAARARPSLAITLQLAPPPARAGVSGDITVESRPAGAQVFLNSRLIGKTPLSAPGVPVGPATVRLERDGYQPWTSEIEVLAGERVRVAASLDSRR
jgi:hypothetical protein